MHLLHRSCRGRCIYISHACFWRDIWRETQTYRWSTTLGRVWGKFVPLSRISNITPLTWLYSMCLIFVIHRCLQTYFILTATGDFNICNIHVYTRARQIAEMQIGAIKIMRNIYSSFHTDVEECNMLWHVITMAVISIKWILSIFEMHKRKWNRNIYLCSLIEIKQYSVYCCVLNRPRNLLI